MKKNDYLLQSVDATLKLIDYLGVRKSATLTQMSQALGIDKTSIYRMKYTLLENDFIVKNPDNTYSLSHKFARYAENAERSNPLLAAAALYVRELAADCGCSVHVYTLNTRSRVVNIFKEEPVRGFQITVPVGFNTTAYSTAPGKILLCEKSAAELSEYLSHIKFKKYCPNTVSGEQELISELAKTRERGYALEVDERFMGFGCVAVPLRDTAGVCAALCVIAPSSNIHNYKDYYLTHLLPKAQLISERLKEAEGRQTAI